MASQADWAQFIAASLRLAASWGPLPPGWQMTVDPASGKFYFYNTTTGVVQWEPPGVDETGAAPAPSQCSAASHTPLPFLRAVIENHVFPVSTLPTSSVDTGSAASPDTGSRG